VGILAPEPMVYPSNSSDKHHKGKAALDIEHLGITSDDEKRMNDRITRIYGVDENEASEIHANYHYSRIFSLLFNRARNHGMTQPMFVDRIKNTNIFDQAYLVSRGELIEMAAVDLLYRQLCISADKQYAVDDRYLDGVYG
jgi:hypothetical protein